MAGRGGKEAEEVSDELHKLAYRAELKRKPIVSIIGMQILDLAALLIVGTLIVVAAAAAIIYLLGGFSSE